MNKLYNIPYLLISVAVRPVPILRPFQCYVCGPSEVVFSPWPNSVASTSVYVSTTEAYVDYLRNTFSLEGPSSSTLGQLGHLGLIIVVYISRIYPILILLLDLVKKSQKDLSKLKRNPKSHSISGTIPLSGIMDD